MGCWRYKVPGNSQEIQNCACASSVRNTLMFSETNPGIESVQQNLRRMKKFVSMKVTVCENGSLVTKSGHL